MVGARNVSQSIHDRLRHAESRLSLLSESLVFRNPVLCERAKALLSLTTLDNQKKLEIIELAILLVDNNHDREAIQKYHHRLLEVRDSVDDASLALLTNFLHYIALLQQLNDSIHIDFLEQFKQVFEGDADAVRAKMDDAFIGRESIICEVDRAKLTLSQAEKQYTAANGAIVPAFFDQTGAMQLPDEQRSEFYRLSQYKRFSATCLCGNDAAFEEQWTRYSDKTLAIVDAVAFNIAGCFMEGKGVSDTTHKILEQLKETIADKTLSEDECTYRNRILVCECAKNVSNVNYFTTLDFDLDGDHLTETASKAFDIEIQRRKNALSNAHYVVEKTAPTKQTKSLSAWSIVGGTLLGVVSFVGLITAVATVTIGLGPAVITFALCGGLMGLIAGLYNLHRHNASKNRPEKKVNDEPFKPRESIQCQQTPLTCKRVQNRNPLYRFIFGKSKPQQTVTETATESHDSLFKPPIITTPPLLRGDSDQTRSIRPCSNT